MKYSRASFIVLALAFGVLAAPSFAQRASRPQPPTGGPTLPPPPTNPIPPRPSSSGVAQNSGLFVTTTFPRSTPAQPPGRPGAPQAGPVAPPAPSTLIVRPSTDL